MFQRLNFQEKIFLIFTFVLGLFLSVVYLSNQVIVQDSVQLLERGYLFSQGYLFPFGPRSTNTNYVYGPFISVFVGLFLKLYQHPLSPLLGILLLHIGSFFLLLRTTFLTKNIQFFLVFIFLFWATPWRASEVFLWNPAFLFPISTLWLYGLDCCFRNKTFMGTFFMVISIAINFQIHNSFLFLATLSLILLLTKTIRVNYLAVFLGAFVGILFLLPTVYIVLKHPEILQQNQKKAPLFHNLIQGGEALKGLLYWFRYPSLYFGATTFQLPKLLWEAANFPQKLWFILKWFMAVMSLVVVFLANVKFFRSKNSSLLKRLTLFALGSLFFVSCLSPVPFNFWHLYLIFPLSLIPLSDYLSQHKRFIPLLLVLAVYNTLYSVITSRHSYKHDATSSQMNSFEKIRSHYPEIEKKYMKYSLKF